MKVRSQNMRNSKLHTIGQPTQRQKGKTSNVYTTMVWATRKQLTNSVGRSALRSCSTCDTHHAVHFNYRLRFTHDETSREKKKGRTYNQYEPNTSAFIRDTANWWRWSFKYTSEDLRFTGKGTYGSVAPC